MVWHWLLTSWRQLIASPLFAFITIASLSIGCCGVLLAGADIKQHLSFERWIPDAGRIALLRLDGQIEHQAGKPDIRHAPDDWAMPTMRPVFAKVPGVEAQTMVLHSGMTPG